MENVNLRVFSCNAIYFQLVHGMNCVVEERLICSTVVHVSNDLLIGSLRTLTHELVVHVSHTITYGLYIPFKSTQDKVRNGSYPGHPRENVAKSPTIVLQAY